MKFKLVKTEIVEIDLDEERKRIKACDFSDEQRERLLKLCDMFEEGKYKECDEFIDSWGRCPELECPEVEFVEPRMHRIVIGALYWEDTTIERVP